MIPGKNVRKLLRGAGFLPPVRPVDVAADRDAKAFLHRNILTHIVSGHLIGDKAIKRTPHASGKQRFAGTDVFKGKRAVPGNPCPCTSEYCPLSYRFPARSAKQAWKHPAGKSRYINLAQNILRKKTRINDGI